MSVTKYFGRFVLLLATLLVAGSIALPAAAAAPSPNAPGFALYVMNKLDDQFRGNKSHGVMNMKVHTKRWDRQISLESWTLGKNYSLMRILSPRKEKGTATLKAKDQLYTYLNKTSRTIKITSGMMGGSWMGSHFTNDDLVRHSRLSRDFHIGKTVKDKLDGQDAYRFTLTAKPDAAVVWGKIVVTVRQSDLQPLRQVFYDEDGAKVRQLSFSYIKEIGGKTLPTKMVMKPLDGSGEYTQVSWDKLDFGVKLKKRFFSLQRLKSIR